MKNDALQKAFERGYYKKAEELGLLTKTANPAPPAGWQQSFHPQPHNPQAAPTVTIGGTAANRPQPVIPPAVGASRGLASGPSGLRGDVHGPSAGMTTAYNPGSTKQSPLASSPVTTGTTEYNPGSTKQNPLASAQQAPSVHPAVAAAQQSINPQIHPTLNNPVSAAGQQSVHPAIAAAHQAATSAGIHGGGLSDAQLAHIMGSYSPTSRLDQAKASRIRQMYAEHGGSIHPRDVYRDSAYSSIS